MTSSAASPFTPVETLPHLLLARSAEHGTVPAYYDRDKGLWRSHRWSQVADRTALVAAALAEHGICKGDAVALIGNRPALVWAMIAAQALGAVPLLLAPELSPETIGIALAKQKVRAAFVDGLYHVETIATRRERLPGLDLVVYGDARGLRQRRESWLVSEADLIASDVAPPALSAIAGPRDIAFIAIAEDDGAATQDVSLDHGTAIAQARNAAALSGARRDDRVFAALPLSWRDGLIHHQILSLLVGFPLIYPGDGAAWLRDLRDAAPTLLFGPPLLYDRLRDAIVEHATNARVRRLLASSGDGAPGALRRLFWIDPVKDRFGLGRIRAAASVAGAASPELARFFANLGIAIRDLDHGLVAAQTASPARNGNDAQMAIAHEVA